MQSTVNENQVRKYLLGSLPEDERDHFEETLICDPEVLEYLEALEGELIDDYLSENLRPEDRQRFETYFLATPARREQYRIHKALMSAIKPPPRQNPPLWKYMVIAASAVAVIIVAVVVWRIIPRSNDVDQGMVALNKAFRAERPIEGRISGLDYAEYRTTRGGQPSNIDSDSLNLAIEHFKSAMAKEPGPAHQGLGRIYLAQKDFDKAISELQIALGIEPSNAQILSDLGLAYLEKGKHETDQTAIDDFAQSRNYLDRAIATDSKLPGPLFNRALLFEELKQTENAQKDWQAYIAKDPDSGWAKIARQRLKP